MSGSSISTGLLGENRKYFLEKQIEKIMDLKIIDLSIQIIPLWKNENATKAKVVGGFLQLFIHPAILSPTLSHIAIQLTLEKGFIVIMEYGQYYSDNSKIKNTSSFASCSDSCESSKAPRKEQNSFTFYYINKDGARITILHKNQFKDFVWVNNFNTRQCNFEELDRGKIAYYSLVVMACNHYNISYFFFYHIKDFLASYKDYHIIECDINNKISLRELCNKFKGNSWEAINYNVVNHNCQTFASEIIKILKAVRIHDSDKIRSKEKLILPNCIISALWDNETLSTINTIGRVPVFGLIFDVFATPFIK